MKIIKQEDGNVTKYVFEKEDAIYEAVLYKYGSYNQRTVICCSTQSGCKVGCCFCGTGKKFIRNLTTAEIIEQIEYILKDKQIDTDEVKKLQFMFMSMGEPMMNYSQVHDAILVLYSVYPNADLLISTSGAYENMQDFRDLITLAQMVPKVGLQFSIHASSDEARDKLIPYKHKLNLRDLRNYGIQWSRETGRQVYLNYCATSKNINKQDANALKNLFDPISFAFTFSVICPKNETVKMANADLIKDIMMFSSNFANAGYNTRVFNPEGQDTIAAGCGQLWFVQKWMKEHNIKEVR